MFSQRTQHNATCVCPAFSQRRWFWIPHVTHTMLLIAHVTHTMIWIPHVTHTMLWIPHVTHTMFWILVHRVLVGKPEEKRPMGSPRRRWENNIKMDLQEVGGGCGDWMELAEDRDRWRALVSTVMNLQVPKMRGIS